VMSHGWESEKAGVCGMLVMPLVCDSCVTVKAPGAGRAHLAPVASKARVPLGIYPALMQRALRGGKPGRIRKNTDRPGRRRAGQGPGQASGIWPGGAPLGMPLFDDGGVSDGNEAQRCGRKVGHCGWAMMAMAAMAAPAGTGLCRRARGTGAAGPAAYRDGGRGCA
jgi:hypothetical protein